MCNHTEVIKEYPLTPSASMGLVWKWIILTKKICQKKQVNSLLNRPMNLCSGNSFQTLVWKEAIAMTICHFLLIGIKCHGLSYLRFKRYPGEYSSLTFGLPRLSMGRMISNLLLAFGSRYLQSGTLLRMKVRYRAYSLCVSVVCVCVWERERKREMMSSSLLWCQMLIPTLAIRRLWKVIEVRAGKTPSHWLINPSRITVEHNECSMSSSMHSCAWACK